MGTHILAAAKASSGSSSTTLLLIVVVFAVMMIFMFRSQRKRQRAAQDTQRQATVGSRIRTVHGIYGTIVDGDDRNVIVEVAPGVRIKMLRQAVGVVVPDDEPDGVLHAEATGMDSEPEASPEPSTDATSGESAAKPEDRTDATI
jgi:preprotein translocase subunit YajC